MSLAIPNYRILEEIGQGAQTVVYRARCMRSGKDYAVKYTKVRAPEDNKIVDLMRNEHAVGSAVNHPTVRKSYEFRLLRRLGRTKGALLFMEFVPGIPMSQRGFQRPLPELLRLFEEVAEGLGAMHRAGFVHADLKPGNILVSPEEHAHLIDFGQSSRMGQSKGRVQGTMDYMAPEQAVDAKLDQRTDVFGLGATLHRVLTGKPVPTEMNQTVNPHTQRLLGKRVDETPQALLEGLPTCVARFIENCCETDPSKRLPSMTVVAEKLELARTIVSKTDSEFSEFDIDEEDLFDHEDSGVFGDDDIAEFLDLSDTDGSSHKV